jgi:uncharacterized membrane protein (DUF485 family)
MTSTKSAHTTLESVAAARWRIAVALTAGTMVVYFGFILLVAFRKEFLGTILTGGLSLGILLGALVIVAAWIFTWIYVRWANSHYDASLAQLRQGAEASPTPSFRGKSPQAEVPGKGSFGGKE